MLITDVYSSHDGSQDLDEYKGQYEEAEYDDVADKPSEMLQEIFQEFGNTETECDDKVTDADTEEDGEYKGQFDDKYFKGIVFAQKDVLCNVQEKAGNLESWILLDSQSTIDVFCNARKLHNIRDAKRQLVLHCNVGTTLLTKKVLIT